MSNVTVSKCFSPNSKAARRSGNYHKSMKAAKHFSEKNVYPKKTFKKSFRDDMIKKYKVTTISPSGTMSTYNIFAHNDEQMNGYFYNAEKNGEQYFSISFFHPLVNKERKVYNICLQKGWMYSQTLKKVTDADNNIVWKDVREFHEKKEDVNKEVIPEEDIIEKNEQPDFLDLPEDEFPEL